MTDYTELRELAQAATPGPWEAVGKRIETDHEEIASCRKCWSPAEFPRWDAEFIAAANPTVVLALLDELRDAKAQAWEEGRQAERYNMEAYEETPLGMTPKRKTNPYREEA